MVWLLTSHGYMIWLLNSSCIAVVNFVSGMKIGFVYHGYAFSQFSNNNQAIAYMGRMDGLWVLQK